MKPIIQKWELCNLCFVSPAALTGLEISFLQVAFCLGLRWTMAQSDQEHTASQGRHGVGVARAQNTARPAPGLSAPGQASESLTTVITSIKLPSIKKYLAWLFIQNRYYEIAKLQVFAVLAV